MSFLHNAVLPGSTAGFHSERNTNNDSAMRTHAGRLRKSQSHGGLLSPLIHLVRNPVHSIGDVLGSWKEEDGLLATRQEHAEKEDRRKILCFRMKEAESYEDWRTAACELDIIEGNDVWKQDNASTEYDAHLIQTRITQLDEARMSCNVSRMLHLIRTSLTRGLGGMGDLRLYKHSHIGTKILIDRYIQSAKETILAVVAQSAKSDPKSASDQFLLARQAFGRSALLLSGGGTFGMNHIGVVKTLWYARLLPRIISGSSAGSIVCAVLCTKTDEEVPKLIEDFCYGDLGVFDKPGEEEGVLMKITRFLKHGVIFDISHLVRVMKDMLGDITFQEAYNRTRRILNISVSSESIHELPRLLNYVTAPNVIIWSAVAASCSVPLFFAAAELRAKDPRTNEEVSWNPYPQRWIDGSVDNDLPMTRLAEMFNVNHFIVSQVNPHVIPFLAREEGLIATAAEQGNGAVAAGPSWLHTMANLARGEVLHRMKVLAELGVFPNHFTKAQSVLSQKYSGDITILPEISYANFPRILTNPDTNFMLQAMLSGEKATWPKLSRIQNHLAIELALDAAVSELRSHIVFSPSQVNLRLNSIMSRAQGLGNHLRGSTTRAPRHRSHRSVETGGRPNPLDGKRPHSFLEIHQKYSPRYGGQARQASSNLVVKVSGADEASSDADDNDAELIDLDEDSDLDYSSDSGTASPPHRLWPATRQLFPSVSQPATPFYSTRFSQNRSSSNISSPSCLDISDSRPNLSMIPVVPARTSSKLNPPTAFSSSSEAQYKLLFHTIPSPMATTSNGEAGSTDLTEERKVGKGHVGKPLKLDISGTRGMLMRRKRTMSTGASGILPPGRQ